MLAYVCQSHACAGVHAARAARCDCAHLRGHARPLVHACTPCECVDRMTSAPLVWVACHLLRRSPPSCIPSPSVYLAPGWEHRGLGRRLLSELIIACAAPSAGVRSIIAVISTDEGDPALGAASIALHVAAGFTHAGRFSRAGIKDGRVMDSVFLQLELEARREG